VQAVRRAAAAVTLLAAALVCAAVQAAQAGGGSGGGGSGGGGGQCTVNLGGQWVTVQCGYGGGTGGGGTGGSGGGGTTLTTTCIFTPLNEVSAKQLGLAWPPPKGMSWALMDCPGGGPGAGPQAILMNNGTGAPQITPQQLLQQALSELRIPALQPGTAPPRGKDGLVGLPEWFWVPAAEWHRLSVTVRAGPVWATATATPAGLSFQPGGGLGAVSCAGPGTAYNAARPASQQHTRCSFTYDQSSAGQPGHVYQAAVVLSWRIAWVGSGGAGGLVDAGLPVPFAFPLPVAQGEALVSSR
jgi:hypothetical protein